MSMNGSMIYLGCWGYTVQLPPTPRPLTSRQSTTTCASVVFSQPRCWATGAPGFLPARPHTDVQSSGCKNAPSHSPSHPDLTIARAQATILVYVSTSPPRLQTHPRGPSRTGLSNSPVMLLVSIDALDCAA